MILGYAVYKGVPIYHTYSGMGSEAVRAAREAFIKKQLAHLDMTRRRRQFGRKERLPAQPKVSSSPCIAFENPIIQMEDEMDAIGPSPSTFDRVRSALSPRTVGYAYSPVAKKVNFD